MVHRPLRWSLAGLMFTATVLAGTSAVLAISRLGTGSALVFATVAVGATILGVAVLYRVRWVVWLLVVGCGGQVAAVVGTVWELAAGIDAGKASELRRLGFDPTFGVLVNLVYSAVAVLLFGWVALRWLRLR